MRTNEIFTEQAEYLSGEAFVDWSTSIHNEKNIIRKLSQSGAKLITGPRGCGKTTLLLKVYNNLIKDKDSMTLPIYVNFKSSLKLEPLYKTNTNAAFWFNQWLLFKVLQGLYNSISDIKINTINTINLLNSTERIINNLELGKLDGNIENSISINVLIENIDQYLEKINKNRCVILFDDAGHAFSSEQQHDFFEFFREIKTKRISPKAAVYPGVTSYSSSFHIGHDAEEIDVWFKPNSSGYLKFMHSLLKTRLGNEAYSQLSKNMTLLNTICFAAYGIPRALLNMIAKFNDENYEEIEPRNFTLTAKGVSEAIKNNFDNTYNIFDTLRFKLPMYSTFIATGANIYETCLQKIKEFNRYNPISKQSSIIAIKRPISTELNKVIGFFQYAGLISSQGIRNRGGIGVYELYELHYSSIIYRNAFFSSRRISFENYCDAFQNRPSHHYPRHTEKGILQTVDTSDIFALALPPCPTCNTPRLSEESKFCSNCGVKLKDISIFESIVSQGIENLPITPNRCRTIRDNSKISSIKDILLDTDNRQLFKVPQIGPYWAKKIKTYAEEFIA
jgi:energy-coupling factor transporter ATP-binding protein EcfA2